MLASLIGRAIEDHSSNCERRENSIFRIFFVEVNKPFATDLFVFGNYRF